MLSRLNKIDKWGRVIHNIINLETCKRYTNKFITESIESKSTQSKRKKFEFFIKNLPAQNSQTREWLKQRLNSTWEYSKSNSSIIHPKIGFREKSSKKLDVSFKSYYLIIEDWEPLNTKSKQSLTVDIPPINKFNIISSESMKSGWKSRLRNSSSTLSDVELQLSRKVSTQYNDESPR